MRTDQKIRSICPKCNEIGTQIFDIRKGAPPKITYLKFYHEGDRFCHIGRIRSTKEVMHEFDDSDIDSTNNKQSDNIAKEIREFIERYSPNTSVRMRVISKALLDILSKNGY